MFGEELTALMLVRCSASLASMASLSASILVSIVVKYTVIFLVLVGGMLVPCVIVNHDLKSYCYPGFARTVALQ